MIRSATASSTRPSLVRWAFRRSTRGFPSQSNTSFRVRRWLRGKGTAGDRAQVTVSVNENTIHGCFGHRGWEHMSRHQSRNGANSRLSRNWCRNPASKTPIHVLPVGNTVLLLLLLLHPSLLTVCTSLAWKPSLLNMALLYIQRDNRVFGDLN